MRLLEVFPNLELDKNIIKDVEDLNVDKVCKVDIEKILYVYLSAKKEPERDILRELERSITSQILKNVYHTDVIFMPEAPAVSESFAPEQPPVKERPKFKRKAKDTEDGMLYGKQFEGEETKLSDIVTEKTSVIVSGDVFSKKLDVTKTGHKIFSFSITDYTDSMTVKMFLADGEEKLNDAIQPGMSVVVNGRIKYDNFEGELVIEGIKGIRETRSMLLERKDETEQKRVELHLHTQLSEMDAMVDVEKLIDQAIAFGHKSLALTDHGVVQAFTPANQKLMKLKEKNPELDFKLIYGLEGYVVDDDDFPICKDRNEDIELYFSSDGDYELPPEKEDKLNAIKKARAYHIIILAKNDIGKKNLYRLVSLSHVNYFHKRPRIPRSVLKRYREGLIIGSACVLGELPDAILSGKDDEALMNIASFYDYLEIQPIQNNSFLIRNYEQNLKGHKVKNEDGLKELNLKILEIGDKLGKKVVATGDVHFLYPQDEIFRRIVMDAQKYSDADQQAPLYYRTTEEMLAEFSYLPEGRAEEVVITNTNLIADQIEDISPVSPDKCPPVLENSDEKLRTICYDTAHEMYGENIPSLVTERLEKELTSIISNGYSVMYMIAHELIKKSEEDGYIVGSRGSVGSSLVATMAKVTEVNPLPPHYRCSECKYYDFDSEEVKQVSGGVGFDLPDKTCPVCGAPLLKDGFDIPFETFLGFNGDKEPDIDLNFSGDYQSKAHDYTEVLFGKGHTFRAGTISTLQEKTIYGFVNTYFEKRNMPVKKSEVERLISGCMGVKRSTGQHPGGIVVLPHGREIYEFTPVQFPANDAAKNTVTTHFDYHSIEHNLLKLDILGHDDPTMIKMLEDLTGIDAKTIKLDDPKVMKLFEGTEVMGIKPEDIDHPLGTLGVPEMGTDIVMDMLCDTKPQKISDLVKISGLSHGTDVWSGNAQKLIKDGTATLDTCICTRDDIMLYLIKEGIEPSLAFRIMESVRKGKGLQPDWEKTMKENGIPDWYSWSCNLIKYMFPKAHAAAYVTMACRIAWFKVYYPLEYYAAFFSIRASSFDYEIMCTDKERLREQIDIIKKRIAANEATPKEKDLLKYMYNVLEMFARGFEFMPIDIYQANAKLFKIIDGKLMPSLSSIAGMGEKQAVALAEAAAKEQFTSREDMKIRAKLSSTLVDKIYQMGICGKLPETSQLSLFDMFDM